MKKLGLLILTIVSIGWLGNFYLTEKINRKIDSSKQKENWRFSLKYSTYSLVPILMTLSIFMIGLSIFNFMIWSSILGLWFVYISLILFLLNFFIVVPYLIYFVWNKAIGDSLILISKAENNMNDNDKYLNERYKRSWIN